MNATSVSVWRTRGFALVTAGVWVLVYFGARIVLERYDLPTAGRIGVAVSPVIPFIGFLACVIAHVRGADELHRRVNLEALAIAFPAAIVLLMVLGLLQLAIPLGPPRFHLRDLWPTLPLLYFASLAIAWRRYQ